MPIAARKPTAEVQQPPQLPKIEPDNMKSVVVDDKSTPLSSLIAYVEGAPWSVDYYGQVLNEHSDLRELDTAQSGVYQHYTRILGLEIRVNSALSSTYDADKAITRVTGSGLVYPFMVPNVSDYFVSETADNQRALFRITQVDRKTFNLESAHSVEFELVGYISQNQEMFQNLESKVVKSYNFSKERLTQGLAPILRSEEYEKVVNLKVLYTEMVRYYFRTFFDRRYLTLVMPGQMYAFYDSYLVNYLLRIVDSFDAPEIRSIKQVPTDRDPYMAQTQFWDLLFNKDYNGRTACNDRMGLVHKHMFNQNTYLHGVMFSNIDYLVYPFDPDTSTRIGTPNDIKTQSYEDVMQTTGFKGTIANAIDNQYVRADKTYVLIHDVLEDDRYVLSNHFYQASPDQSVLEILVKDYMQKKTLDLDMLIALCNQFRQWNRLNQFYYGPILLTLIKEADRTQYS